MSSSAPSENAAAQANAATSANDPAAIADGAGEESRPSKGQGSQSASRHSMPVASVTAHTGHARARTPPAWPARATASTRAHSEHAQDGEGARPVPPRKR